MLLLPSRPVWLARTPGAAIAPPAAGRSKDSIRTWRWWFPRDPVILIDQIRDINSHVAYRPFEARAKVYILFEAETMNPQAANAFLRTLEEPPPHVHFVLVTDAADRMLPTIVSRCQHVPFSRTPMPLIAEHLERRYQPHSR